MDQQRFKSTVIPLYRRLYVAAYSVLGNEDDASDAVQDAYTRLWNMRHRLDSLESVEAFALTVVRHIAIDRLRSSGRSIPGTALDDTDILAQQPVDIETSDRLNIVMQLMERLPQSQQLVLRLSAIDGLSNEEVAKYTGLSDANVRQLLSRARKKLLKMLKAYDYE